jgi:hypothetical protein
LSTILRSSVIYLRKILITLTSCCDEREIVRKSCEISAYYPFGGDNSYSISELRMCSDSGSTSWSCHPTSLKLGAARGRIYHLTLPALEMAHDYIT